MTNRPEEEGDSGFWRLGRAGFLRPACEVFLKRMYPADPPAEIRRLQPVYSMRGAFMGPFSGFFKTIWSKEVLKC
jgi:hypothetical protein